MPRMSILVRAEWDPEAQVFVATSEDVPGLVAEAATPAELHQKLQILIPELLDLNLPHAAPETFQEVPLYIMHEQVSRIKIHA